jgi:hypothetical protein
VHEVGHYPELHQDARSTKYKNEVSFTDPGQTEMDKLSNLKEKI